MLKIFNGDCLEILRAGTTDSIDSLVTDPPAGISFMGKSWDDDKGGRDQWIAWMTEIMTECLRVMKPGAHGLVWALPRTSHWTATALENAGFEVRDVITHLFGSGFPKSLSIDKAIDKAAGAEREVVGIREDFAARANKKRVGKNFMDETVDDGSFSNPQTVGQITAPATDAAKQWQGWGTALKPASEHWILVTKPGVNSCLDLVLSAEPNTQLTKHGLAEAEDLLVHMLAQTSLLPNQREKILQLGRAVNGLDTTAMSLLASLVGTIDLSTVSSWKNISDADLEKVKTFTTLMEISPTTGLKTFSSSQSQSTPNSTTASEHYILIRKPLSENTIAANVLKWSTGGINIDASRIGEAPGRFPANLVLDEEAAAALDEQVGHLAGAGNTIGTAKKAGTAFGKEQTQVNMKYDNGGSASRFFYVAKASKRDKGEGNVHATVKSTALMTYLIKLITPPNGIVIDPFMGSGSTGVAAITANFGFVGIERESEYYAIASKRLGVSHV